MGSTSGDFGKSLDHAQCTAMSKRSGSRCKGPALLNSPNQKCRMHGGHAQHAIGAANPGFKTGRHSRYLPAQLDRLYREALSNPDLLEMADHIALLEAHIQEVLAAASAGDPVPRWADVSEVFAEVETIFLSGDLAETVLQCERMHRVLDAGQKWDSTWDQIVGTMEQLRKMTDTEIKRKKELNQMVPVERVIILMAAVGQAVKRNVSNPDEIAAVYRELAMLHGTDRVPGKGSESETRVGPEIIDVAPRKSRNAKLRELRESEIGA